jgi:hypothetical protein
MGSICLDNTGLTKQPFLYRDHAVEVLSIRENQLVSLEHEFPASVEVLYLCHNKLSFVDLRYLKKLRYVCICNNELAYEPLLNEGVRCCTDFNPFNGNVGPWGFPKRDRRSLLSGIQRDPVDELVKRTSRLKLARKRVLPWARKGLVPDPKSDLVGRFNAVKL